MRRVNTPNGDDTEMYDTTGLWQRIRGKKEYRTFTTDASGNTKMNVTVQDRKGRRTEVETDAYATVTRKYDRDGVKMREDTKTNAALLKYAMKKTELTIPKSSTISCRIPCSAKKTNKSCSFRR